MTGDRQLEPDATNVARLTYTATVKDGSNIVNDTDWIEKEVMQVNGTSPTDSEFQAICRVINIDTTNKYLYVIPYAGTTKHTQFEADVGSYVFLHSSGAPVGGNYFTINAVKPNDILPFSGDIIYLVNRGLITRAAGKTETVRIILEFSKIFVASSSVKGAVAYPPLLNCIPTKPRLPFRLMLLT